MKLTLGALVGLAMAPRAPVETGVGVPTGPAAAAGSCGAAAGMACGCEGTGISETPVLDVGVDVLTALTGVRLRDMTGVTGPWGLFGGSWERAPYSMYWND